MGIPPLKEFLDNKIEEQITISDEAKAAWKRALPQHRLPKGGAVFDIFIEDLPTRIYTLASQPIDIHTLFERLSQPYRVDNRARVFVAINDNSDYDVPTKRKTHEERKSRPIRPGSEPYSPETVQWIDAAPWIAGVDSITAERLMNTPHLRKCLLYQFSLWLQATRHTIEWPKDTYLVLDERDQPIVFTSEPDQPVPWNGLDESKFPLWPVREADVKAILWAKYLVQSRPDTSSSVCIQTSDSDALALGIYHWWDMPSKLYWQPIVKFNEKPLHWPLHWLIQYIVKPQTLGNRDAFLVFAVTMGSDHFKTRKQILHGCRHETAWEMLKAKNWTLKQWITWVKGIPPPPGDPSDPDNWQTELMAALHYWETLGLDYDRNEVVPCSPLGARRLLLPQIEAKSSEDDATMVEEEEEEVSQRLGPSFVLLMPQQQQEEQEEEEEDMSPRLNHPTDLHAQRRAQIREEQQQQDEELERRDYVFVDVDQSTLTLPPLEPPTQPEPDLMDVTAIP